MKNLLIILMLAFTLTGIAQTAEEILDKVDKNMSAKNRIIESEMTIHGKRKKRTMTSISYSIGTEKSFTEYLSPAREKGTKMLKLDDKLWIYSPSTDRTIQISGHLLRQSVMGSDFSYEDMMDDSKLTDVYTATVLGNEILADVKTFVLELITKKSDVAYYKRKVWVDASKYVPLKEELYGKSGQLLKKTTLSEPIQVQGKWFPSKMVYKDMLKQGDGTELRIISIKFDQEIKDYIFSKAALKK